MASQWSQRCLDLLSKQIVINEFVLKPLNLEQDIAMLQSWLNQDYAKFWGMQGMTQATITAAMAPSNTKWH